MIGVRHPAARSAAHPTTPAVARLLVIGGLAALLAAHAASSAQARGGIPAAVPPPVPKLLAPATPPVAKAKVKVRAKVKAAKPTVAKPSPTAARRKPVTQPAARG